ncbi:MAG TPA: PilW family protein [Gallionellaceae bacterium]|nr:PilW family protein [Gallionellaceae bacterium]
MAPHQNIKYRNSGFSLVEIMVGMVISLLSVVIILQVFAAFEGQKRTTTGGADAQTNGAIALFTVERDVRMAGYGFSNPGILGCVINSYYNGAPLPTFSLAPVTITNGAGGLPDSISILASSKGSGSLPARITSSLPPVAAPFDLNTNLGIAVNDLLIAFQPGLPCTLLQVTNIPPGSTTKIDHQGGSQSLWNPTGIDATNLYPPGGYTNRAMLFNLGQVINHTYSLDAQNNLLFTDYSSQTNTSVVQSLMPDIVNMQAQYGFDRRVGPQTDAQVSANGWQDNMIDADGDGVVGNPGDIARIYGVRLAVVARSGQQEKVNPASGLCDTTTTAPTWLDGTAIDVSRHPDGTANADWKCYRYKTFETIIPLRNLIWRE